MNHIDQGAKHIWLPYTQMQNHLPQLEIKSAKGSKLFLQDGRILIDGIASWWSVAHGYSDPHITKAIISQAKILPHIMLAGFANEQTYKLAHRLTKFANLERVFFSDSGSTAIEVAMKIAWQYHINLQQPQKTKFVSFKNSYHGDTTGAMSLADLTSGMHQKFEKILLKNINLSFPKNQNDLDKFDDFIKKNHHEIAAFFVEPLIQCAGGMIFHDAKILKAVFDIAKKYNLIFVADECAVGFYRTGKKFAYHQANIQPDILVVGKALTGGFLTLAATLVCDKIFNTFLDKSLNKALMHGPTFMGNALAAAAANASLDLFEQKDYEKNVLKIEKTLKQEFKKLKNKNIISTRIIGAVGVIETNFSMDEIFLLRQKFIANGIFLRPFANIIYVMPPLTITKTELLQICKAIELTLQNFKN